MPQKVSFRYPAGKKGLRSIRVILGIVILAVLCTIYSWAYPERQVRKRYTMQEPGEVYSIVTDNKKTKEGL
jgi:hypothetical protein